MTTETQAGALTLYDYPAGAPRSELFTVRVEGRPAFVFRTGVADFVSFAGRGPVTVEVTAAAPIGAAVVRPIARGVPAEIKGTTARLRLPEPMNLRIEIDGLRPLYLFAGPPEEDAPPPEGPGVHRFLAGQIYDVGVLRLGDGETLYIEGGAIVRGVVRATGARGVRVRGRGVLDGGGFSRERDPHRSIVLEGCADSSIEGITMIRPSSWMITLGACRDVQVRGVRQLGEVLSSDGVDIAGSRDVLVEGCCFHNNDDCIAIKALDIRDEAQDATLSWEGDVERVLVRDCILSNDKGGNAMEIGHELRADHVREIRFEEIDVIGVHGYGAPFSIHNADRATVSAVRFERIRVEHHYDKLIDLRVLTSRWGRDPERGRVRDILFKEIAVTRQPYNEGYTVSLIGGYDAEHTIEDVVFERVVLDGRLVESADQLDLYLKHAAGVSFR